MSYSTKFLVVFGVLPLVLKKFTQGDIVLWNLFSTIIVLQTLADFGFRQTFSRFISYAYGGAKSIEEIISNKLDDSRESKTINLNLLNKIFSSMKYIYLRLTVLVFFIAGIFGSLSLLKPIKFASNANEAWMSWAIVFFVSLASFYGRLYLNFLEGINKIAIVRRVEALTSLATIVSSILVLMFKPSLLNLIIVNQFWALVVVIRDWYLCTTIEKPLFENISKTSVFDKSMILLIWQSAWRSGISSLMSMGLTNLTGIVYAQVGDSAAIAAYLLALRIINQIRDVSMAPFYSKIPYLNMLRIKNELNTFTTVVKRGMFLSHTIYVIGFLSIAFFADAILQLIGTDATFVSKPMWLLMGFAFFVHRFGAMHIQVYLTTNHVIAHIADGISGVIYIVSAVFLVRYINEYAIPVAMLIGYFGFYSWYAARYSYKSMNTNYWSFEKKVSIPAIIIFAVYGLIFVSF